MKNGTGEVIDALNRVREEFDLDLGDTVLIFGTVLAQMVDEMRAGVAAKSVGAAEALEWMLEALPAIGESQTAWVEAAIDRGLCGRRADADRLAAEKGRPS